MRLLIISAITLLFVSSFTDQERIDQYEKQLKESNEALEEVINYRRRLMRSKAIENPEKAGYWKDLSEQYYSASLLTVSHYDETDFTDSLLQTLRFDESWNNVSDKLEPLSTDDSIVAKNVILNQLNKTLLTIAMNTSSSNDEIIIPLITTKVFPNKDSTLVILVSNFPLRDNNFDVYLENPTEVKIKPLHSLGYFFIKPYQASNNINGFVNFRNDYQLRSWQIKFSNDSIYEPTFNKTH